MSPTDTFLFLFFLLVLSFQRGNSHQYTVYVNSSNGKVETNCWTGELQVACKSVISTLKRGRMSKLTELANESTRVNLQFYADAIECPTWMYFSNQTNECVCGVSHNDVVKCNATRNETYILDCYQMTYDENHQQIIAGLSFYGCLDQANPNDIYHLVPANRSQVNKVMCSLFHRDGRLCGACRDGYSPLIYSYQLHCKQCSEAESKYNWAIFMAVAFIPLTVFYIFVVLFKFNANSPHLHSFVFFTQIIGAPANIRALTTGWRFGTAVTSLSKALATLFGIWNLDFFRTVYPDICLRLTTLQALSLDYIIAFYPLVLILLTYVLIKLHFRGFRILYLMWKPIKTCLLKFKDESNIKASLIDVFATFLLLSYSKILYVNCDLLTFTKPVDLNGKSIGTFLYYDASYEYFGPDHLPYGVLALVTLTIFNILPFLLLLFYPMKCFQRCLNHLKLSHLALHTFVDSFAGCYKDGTEPGTRDCRHFAALFLFLRLIICTVCQVILTSYMYGWVGLILTIFIILLVMIQPYKSKHNIYNAVSTAMLGIMVLVTIAIMNTTIAFAKAHQAVTLSAVTTAILIALPQFYILGMAVKWIYKRNILKKLILNNQILERSPSESPLLDAMEGEP